MELTVLGLQLDSRILKDFSNLNDSVIQVLIYIDKISPEPFILQAGES